jgi:hypothetical protein
MFLVPLFLIFLFGVALPVVAGIGLIVESRRVFFKVIGGLLLAQVFLAALAVPAAAWYTGKLIGDWANSRSHVEETIFKTGE